MQAALVSVLILVAAVLFARETWTVDVVTLVMVLVLLATGIVTPAEAFAGFASDIVFVLGSLFVVTGALQDTGVVDVATARLFRVTPRRESRLVAWIMAVAATLSSVLNNTTVTGLFVGPTSALAQRAGRPPSRLLMPLAFASLVGGTCTLIGTSTNIAVNGQLGAHGLEPLGFFELTPLGIVLVVVAIAWMAFVGRHTLPSHHAPPGEAAAIAGSYLSEMLVLPDSPLAGKRLGECGFAERGIRVVRLVRDGEFVSARNSRKLLANDVLLFVGEPHALIEVKAMPGIEIHAEVKLGATRGPLAQERVAEAVVLPDSRLVGSTLREAALYDASGAVVLGLHRRGHTVRQPLVDIEVRAGDVLLVQGDADALGHAQLHWSLAFTSAAVSTARLRRNRGWIVAAAFVLAIAVAAAGLAPLAVCFLAAAVVTVVSRCLESERALEHVPWRLLILIGGMTAFATAVQKSGADELYAGLIESWLAPWGPLPVLAGFMVVTMVLSQTMSNAAAALVVLPVAVAAATRLGLDARPFAIGITVASSLALATPFEPSCALVFGPGRYRFRDYYVAGLPLSLVLLVTALLLVPQLWPFAPR